MKLAQWLHEISRPGAPAWWALALALAGGPAAAEPRAAPMPPFELHGSELTGQATSLHALRGSVVMVFYWSTSCAVCIDKLHELRANAAGWRDKAFRIVPVNVDRTRDDLMAYEAAARVVLRNEPVLRSIWRGNAGFRDSLGDVPNRLPFTLVIDPEGRVIERHEGRVPPEVWDRVAELLP